MDWFTRLTTMPLLLGAADGAGAGSAGDDDDDLTGTGDDAGAREGDDDAGDAGDVEGRSHAGAEDDDEGLLADEAEEDETRPLEDRFKALKKAHRKVKGRLLKNLNFIRLARENDLSPSRLTDIIGKARNFDALSDSVGGDLDKLSRALRQSGAEPDTTPKGKTTSADEDEFDEAKLPWDPNKDPAAKYLAKMARSLHEDGKRSKQILARLQAIEGGVVQERNTRVQQTWISARDAAAKRITDEDIRSVFHDLVTAGFKHAMENPVKRITPQMVIDYYLKKLKINPTQARIAHGAAAQRIAADNAARPRGQAGGAPASAKQRPKETTIAQVTKRLRSEAFTA